MPQKFSRWFYNVVVGRRTNYSDKRLDLDKTKQLLSELESRECLSARISYDHPHIDKRFFDQETTISKAYEFVLATFRPTHILLSHHAIYSEGHHVVYSNFFREMHYIEVISGVIGKSKAGYASQRVIKSPQKVATLEFLVKKE